MPILAFLFPESTKKLKLVVCGYNKSSQQQKF